MEQKKPISHIVAGLIISTTIILLSVLLTFTAGGSDPKGGWINYLIIILGLVFFIQLYGKAKDHNVTFGDLFSYGFKTTAIITLIFVLFLIVLSFVSPDIKQKVIEATRTELESKKGITDQEIESLIDKVRRFFWVILIGTTIFFFLLIGCIGSLLGAAITKKNPQTPFEQTSY